MHESSIKTIIVLLRFIRGGDEYGTLARTTS